MYADDEDLSPEQMMNKFKQLLDDADVPSEGRYIIADPRMYRLWWAADYVGARWYHYIPFLGPRIRSKQIDKVVKIAETWETN